MRRAIESLHRADLKPSGTQDIALALFKENEVSYQPCWNRSHRLRHHRTGFLRYWSSRMPELGTDRRLVERGHHVSQGCLLVGGMTAWERKEGA